MKTFGIIAWSTMLIACIITKDIFYVKCVSSGFLIGLIVRDLRR